MKWKCTVCDHVFDAEKPSECPSCNASDFKLKKIGFKVKNDGWEF